MRSLEGRRGRRVRSAVLTALGASLLLATLTPAASAAPSPGRRGIDVVQVNGYLDPPNAGLVADAVRTAERRHATVLIFQLDSGGAVDVDVPALVRVVRSSRVPVAFWVGPSGSTAAGGAAVLAESGAYTVVSQGSGIGPVRPERLDRPGARTSAQLRTEVAGLLAARGRDPGAAGPLVSRRLSATDAKRLGAADDVAPTLVAMIGSLDGKTLATAAGPRKLSTIEVVHAQGNISRRPNQPVRFGKLGLVDQLRHTLGTPWVAYFLLVAGLALMVFEFFTAGVGLAGFAGALAALGACYGFSHLPTEWWAVVLLLLGVLGLSVDLQAGGLGFWTVVGAAALVAGSVTLYGGSSRLDPAWWVVALVCLGTVVFMLGGMTAMVRSRFSTPTVGREGMVGELGAAEVDVDPDGVVRVRGALWRARTNRATPISAGDPVRVAAVEGLVLEVEPLEGAARDARH